MITHTISMFTEHISCLSPNHETNRLALAAANTTEREENWKVFRIVGALEKKGYHTKNREG